jgi:ethanolamine ammonia-lyase small subunit
LDGIVVRSAVRDRAEYLRRPDLGRQLSSESRPRLEELKGDFDCAFIVADGLSPLAIHKHAAELVRALLPRLLDWRLAPIVIVEQGRVAIGDGIGSVLGAALSVVMIGERPGLSSPDSLGVYVTWAPQPGRTDAERNCISNIASSGEFVGDVAGSVLVLAQKEVKLPAGGIKGALQQFFRFEGVDERATLIVDPVVQNFLDAFPS